MWFGSDEIRSACVNPAASGWAEPVATPVKLSQSPEVQEETFQIVPRRRLEALPPPLRSSPSAAVSLLPWSGHVWTAVAAELPAGGGGR